MSLSVTIYTDSGKTRQLADYTSRIHPSAGGGGLKFGSGPHGFAACELPLVPMGLDEAFAVLNWPGLPWVVVSDRLAGVQWEGRLEGRRQVMGGVALTAFGAARALSDVMYTGMFSDTGLNRYRTMTQNDIAGYTPELYQIDTNNRIYIGLKKNEVYAYASDVGAITYENTHTLTRNIIAFSCSYDMTLPADWRLDIIRGEDDFSSLNIVDTITATGSNQTGTLDLTFTGQPRLFVRIFNYSGGATNYTSATGLNYLKLTNIRIKSDSSASVTASNIAGAVVAFVASVNSGQLSSSTALIEATTDDLKDEIYEDEKPADILDRLALLHGFEWGVWHNQTLYFREKGSQGRTFYVDVTSLELESDIDPLVNSAYAVYQDANGRTLRGAVSDDDNSQERFGIVRRAALSVRTTSSTQAAAHLAAFLADRADYALRATVGFDSVYDANGGRRELYELKSSDTLVLRNLPANAGPVIDNIRSFRMARLDYTADPEGVSVEPDVPTPTLVTLVARQEKGLRT